MSIVDDLLPSRGRGRPPKAKETDQTSITPLERVLSEPLPQEIVEAAAELNSAIAAVKEATRAYREADAEAKRPLALRMKDADSYVASAERNIDYFRSVRTEDMKIAKAARLKLEEVEATTHRSVIDLAKRQDPPEVRAAKQELAQAEALVKATDLEIEGWQTKLAEAKKARAALDATSDVVAHDALQRALAKREVAKRLGGEAPTDEDIEALERAYEEAKRQASMVTDTILETIQAEVDRRAAWVRDAHTKLHKLLQPLREKWAAAADEQLANAVTLIAQTEQLECLLQGYGVVYAPFKRDRFTGQGSHEGDATVPNLEGVLSITHALRVGLDHMNPRLR